MPSQFLALPADVRNDIYEHIFVRGQTSWSQKTQRMTAVLLTCRQVYEEARGLYWSSDSCTLSNNLAIAKRLVFPPAVLRIIASCVLKDQLAPKQPGLSKSPSGGTAVDDYGDMYDVMLVELDVELIRAYGKYTRGRRLGRYFWHDRLGLRKGIQDSNRPCEV